VKFTEANVKAFVMPAGKDDHYEWDDAMPGFGFRCRNVGGSKVYLVKYRVGVKQRKVTLALLWQIVAIDRRDRIPESDFQ
jgi:hypothetical protein